MKRFLATKILALQVWGVLIGIVLGVTSFYIPLKSDFKVMVFVVGLILMLVLLNKTTR